MSDFYKDPIGRAIHDYAQQLPYEDIVVHSDVCEDDVLPTEWLFRSFEQMPEIEQLALQRSQGRILDVGSGAGCHSLYLTQQKLEVTSIDTSIGAIDYQLKEGINAKCTDFFEWSGDSYDTLLFLMNGIGLCGTFKRLPVVLKHAYSLLRAGGKILCDSTDVRYLYEEEDGSVWVDLNSAYYGDLRFQMEYKTTQTDWFDWLYVDFDSLKKIAEKQGFTATVLLRDGAHYLAELTKI